MTSCTTSNMDGDCPTRSDQPLPDSSNTVFSSCLTFPPCYICGGKASGLHYGCNTCEPCKNFFKRYLKRNKEYICSNHKKCDISVYNKSNCSACRLAKCLGFGMSKTKCKLGRYSYARRTEAIRTMKELEGTREAVVQGVSPPCPSSDDSVRGPESVCVAPKATDPPGSSSGHPSKQPPAITEDIELLTQGIMGIKVFQFDIDDEQNRNEMFKACHEKYMNKVGMFGTMNAVTKEEYQALLKNFNIDIDGQFQSCQKSAKDWEKVLQRFHNFAKNIPGFSDLSCDDQSQLLKSTYMLAFAILTHKGFSTEYEVMLDITGDAFHMEEYSDKCMSRAYMESAFKFAGFMQKLELTKEEMAILVTIATFSSDRSQLENPELVEKIQMKYVDLLSRHVHSKLSQAEARSRFSKILDSLTRVRQIAEMYHEEMEALSRDDFILDTLPMINSFV